MIFALLISGTVCFASNKDGKIETKKTEKNANQTVIITESEEVGCIASCWARIERDGIYITTLWGSGTAADCTTAQNNCLSALNVKVKAFISAAE